MRSGLNKDQVEDLLDYVGADKVGYWKGTKISFCCPIHGESNPSCGINIDYVNPKTHEHGQVFHCFSCHESGGLGWFVYRSLPDEFKSLSAAEKFLSERYEVELKYIHREEDHSLRRYEDFYAPATDTRFVIPNFKLALFKSGKETFQYFFERGFTKSEVKEYQIGRDLDNDTVTVPAFWDDGKLAGVIGRYIDPDRPKNSRFRIYDFPKGSLIYPLDKLETIDNTIIGVEAMFDCIRVRRLGYKNCCAMMGDGMSASQAEQIKSRCSKFIDMFDNDEGGVLARKQARKMLGKDVVYCTVEYPDHGKDPCQWSDDEIHHMISGAKSSIRGKLPRL